MLQGEAVDPVARADKRDNLDCKLCLRHPQILLLTLYIGQRKIDNTLQYLGNTSPIDIDKLLPEGPKLF
jgi:hypothetical protein